MAVFQVCEKFVSINGEGKKAGQLAVFLRFKGCNLSCSYCDTKWANSENAISYTMNEHEIYDYIKSKNVKNVTITGGEPLMRDDMDKLLVLLKTDKNLCVEIETNGAVDLAPFCIEHIRPSFTMDYKLPSSNMERKMIPGNFALLGKNDCVKFVAGSKQDLVRAYEVMKEYDLIGRCGIYLSPVFGEIEPAQIVDFMTQHSLNDVNMQIQLHKVIWDPNERGV